MDTTRLSEGRDELLSHMERVGYSHHHIDKVRGEIGWLCANRDSFGTYEEALDLRAPRGNPRRRRNHRCHMGICRDFDVDGRLPEMGRRPRAPEGSSYGLLNPAFAQVVDLIRSNEEGRGLARKSVGTDTSLASSFLLRMQGMGRASLSEITEGDVVAWALGEGAPAYGRRIRHLLTLDLGDASPDAERVARLIPVPTVGRANIDYLRPDEVEAIREALRDEGAPITARDRAMVTTLFYTGLRASDVCGLRLGDIDWDGDEIRVTQSKTGVPVELPLTARVGNAIWAYLGDGRPESDDTHVFLSARRPHGPITTPTVDRAVCSVMDAAGVRVGDGRRRGSHLFRHNAATTIVASGMSPMVAGAALGHEDPGTVDRYLHADVEHLRECALDVSAFGLGEGAFDV